VIRAVAWVAAVCAFATTARAWAQAEPAPPDYVPPAQRGLPARGEPSRPSRPPPPPSKPITPEFRDIPQRYELAASARLTFRIGDGPDGLPQLGFGGGVRFHAALVRLGRVRLGVGAHFAYDKISRDTSSIIVAPTTQQLTHATFAAVAVADALLWRLRPWVAAGGGFSVASYTEPAAMPGAMPIDDQSVLGLATVAGGCTLDVYEGFELGVHADALFTFSSAPWFSPGVVGLALDAGFRF
jgi:hypothetical protein